MRDVPMRMTTQSSMVHIARFFGIFPKSRLSSMAMIASWPSSGPLNARGRPSLVTTITEPPISAASPSVTPCTASPSVSVMPSVSRIWASLRFESSRLRSDSSRVISWRWSAVVRWRSAIIAVSAATPARRATVCRRSISASVWWCGVLV